MRRRQFRTQLFYCWFFFFFFGAEQDQSDCSGDHGGPARSDDWLGLEGQIQQKERFRGSCAARWISRIFLADISEQSVSHTAHFCF